MTNISQKIVYGYAIALSVTIVGSLSGVFIGNTYHQESLQKYNLAVQERKFLSDLKLSILYNRPAKQLAPFLQDPVAFRRESNKLLDRIRQIEILLEERKALGRDSSILGLQQKLNDYLDFIKKFREEMQDSLYEIERLAASPSTLTEAELLLLKLVKKKNFVKFIEFPDQLLPFTQLTKDIEKNSEVALYQAKILRSEISIISLLFSTLISVIFTFKISKAISSEQTQSQQKLQEQLQELQKSQIALTKSEAHQKALITAIPDLLMRISRDGIYLEVVVSSNFVMLQNKQDVLGRHVSECLPKDMAQKRLEAIHSALASNSMQVYEQNIYNNGKLTVEEVRVVPCGQDEVLAVVRDISDRKKAEQELKQLNQLLEIKVAERTKELWQVNKLQSLILDTEDYSIITFDLNGVIQTFNAGAEKILGYRREEVVGIFTPMIFYDPQELADLATELSLELGQEITPIDVFTIKANQSGIHEQEWINIRKDGVRIPVSITLTAMKDDQDCVIGYLGIGKDISDRKQAETQLQRLSERLALALKSAAIGCWEWDIQQNNALWDERMYELYGIQANPDPSQNCYILEKSLHPEDRDAVMNLLQQTVLGEAEYDTEFRIVLPDRSIRHIKAYGVVSRDAKGNPKRMTGVNFDISDRKKAEALLQQVNQELMRASRLKDEFLATMSHELRTPLNAILGITEGLQEEVFGSLNEKQINVLSTIKKSGNHLLELINDILDLSKIEAGKLSLDYTMCNVQQLCNSSIIFVKQQAMKKRIKLTMQVSQAIPSSLELDERRIRQALINLLINAVKFTPEGGQVALEVTLAKEIEAQWVRFSVIDSGIGIDSDGLKVLFQPFIQIDSALNRKYEGTGLGLALVKRIVELHDGLVYATSEVGVGSCFTIDIPCPAMLLPPNPSLPEIPIVEPSPIKCVDVNVKSSLILLAEDNEANIVSIVDYLQAKGYRLLIAKDGQEAIALVRSHQPDLILMDIQMPVLDGLEAIKWIRLHHSSDLPIIAISALAMTGDREKCLEVGANAYLSKPIQLQKLVTMIQSFLSKE